MKPDPSNFHTLFTAHVVSLLISTKVEMLREIYAFSFAGLFSIEWLRDNRLIAVNN